MTTLFTSSLVVLASVWLAQQRVDASARQFDDPAVRLGFSTPRFHAVFALCYLVEYQLAAADAVAAVDEAVAVVVVVPQSISSSSVGQLAVHPLVPLRSVGFRHRL